MSFASCPLISLFTSRTGVMGRALYEKGSISKHYSCEVTMNYTSLEARGLFATKMVSRRE